MEANGGNTADLLLPSSPVASKGSGSDEGAKSCLQKNKKMPDMVNDGREQLYDSQKSTMSLGDYETWEIMSSAGKELDDVTDYNTSKSGDVTRNSAHAADPSTKANGNSAVSKQAKCEKRFDTNGSRTSKQNESNEDKTFNQVVKDSEPTQDELEGMLIPKTSATVIDQEEEFFRSLPNLNYTTVDEEGNLVGSERNLLYDGRGRASLDTPEPGQLGPILDGSVPEYSSTHTSTEGLIASSVSSRRLHRAWSTSQLSRQDTAVYNPRPLGGRHSRYTWYRKRKKRAIHTASSVGGASVASFSLWQTTRQEKGALLCFAILNLSSMMCISVLAPFFPKEAGEKGMRPTTIGWIFGSFSLAQLFFSPLFGKLLRWVDARFMFLAGQFFGGACFGMFGLVAFIPVDDGVTVYTAYCFLLRMCSAIGCAAASTASFALTASTFREATTTVFGILETFSGLGLTLGPAVGGALYDVGGFVWPFFVLGGLMVVSVPLNMCLLRGLVQEESGESGSHSMLSLLRIPSMLVTCLCVAMGGLVWAMLDPILQPHLSPFNVSPTKVGLFFLLMCSMYAIFSPLWGWLCDLMDDSSPMMLMGLVLSGVGLLLLGPSTVLGLSSTYGTLWLNIVALVVLGIAVSLAVIPTFDKMLDSAEKAGMENGLELYGLIAGLWGCVYALGDFAGPTLGGYLTDKFGFASCVTYVAYACGALAVIVLCLWIWELCTGPCQMIGSSTAHAQKQATAQNNAHVQNSDTADERRPLLRSV